MNKILALLMALGLVSTPAPKIETNRACVIDRIEDGNIAVVEVVHGEDEKMVDVPMEDLINPVKQNDHLQTTMVRGKFYTILHANNHKGREETLYQFRSNDNEVWWLLTEDQIGAVPKEDVEYDLVYYNNGTTKDNKPCDCPKEWDCECEVYDDIFLGIWEAE